MNGFNKMAAFYHSKTGHKKCPKNDHSKTGRSGIRMFTSYNNFFQSHFPEETDFVEVQQPPAQQPPPQPQQEPRDRFWFLDFD